MRTQEHSRVVVKDSGKKRKCLKSEKGKLTEVRVKKSFWIVILTSNKNFFLITMDTDTSNFFLVNVRIINHFTVVIKINSDCVVQRLDWFFRRCRPSFRVQIQELDFVSFGEDDIIFDVDACFAVTREFARRTETFTPIGEK